MKNKLYRETFEQVKLSDECFRKVMNMELNEKRVKNYRVRIAAIIVVVLVAFGCGNLVTYAATGNTLVKEISNTIKSKKNNKKAKKINSGKAYEVELENGVLVKGTKEGTVDDYYCTITENDDGVELKIGERKSGE